MKQKLNKFLSVFLSMAMVLSVFASIPLEAHAETNTAKVSTYESIESTLAPGVTQTINSAYRDDGNYVKYYVTTADINRDDVGLNVTYKNAQSTVTGMAKMTEQAASMTALHTNPDDEANYIPYYAIVAGVNGDGYDTGSGKPSGAHVMNYVNNGFGITKSGNSPWFALFEDGTAACGRANADWDEAVAAHGAVKEAIGGFQLLMKDGNVIEPGTGANQGGSTYWQPGFDYPCSFLGVTEDNKVILMNCDGNGSGGSRGFDYDDTIYVAQELGIKDLLCLDGGGSATYISRPEGSNHIELTSNPSDGSERQVSNGLVVYTTTPPSDTFEYANITVENSYVTPGSKVKVTAVGVSPAGTAADIPENAVWSVTHGTIENDVFISDGTVGDAEISLVVDGNVVGTTTVHVVYPDSISFTRDSMTVPYNATVELEVVAKYGLNTVPLNKDDITFELEDATAGTINGWSFTANESGSDTTIKVIVNNTDPVVSDTISVKFGKASEVVFNFEEGTDSANLANWRVSNHGGYNVADLSIVTAETGKVHSGDTALAFHYPMDEAMHGTHSFWSGNSLVWTGDSIELKNATSLGFWIYVPEDAVQFALHTSVSLHDEEGNFLSRHAGNIEVYDDESINNMEYSGWRYFKMPISKDLIYIEDNADAVTAGKIKLKANCLIEFYAVNINSWLNDETNFAGDFTFYIDDITVDYSDAVDDREEPIFSGMTYAVEGMSDAATLDGQTVNKNIVSFAGVVADDLTNDNASGLDATSAVAYIDGVKVECEYADGLITIADAQLFDGVHTIRMGIADKMGNYAETKRQIAVDTDSDEASVRVKPQDSTLNYILNDAVYWVDVEADDIENVKTIEMKLDLDSMNNWELEHIETLYGFDCEYSFATASEKAENILTIKFIRNNDYLAETGTNVIASLPIRVWDYVSSDDHLHANAVEAWNCKYGCGPALSIDVDTEMGVVTYLDDTSHTFSSEDIHTLCVSYEIVQQLRDFNSEYYTTHSYHTHTAVAIDDKNATCTENGYTGRTYCETCASVVEWGTTVEAKGHTFAITEGVLKCECGQTFTGVWTDEKEYVDGVALVGWNNDSYYVDGKKLTGVQLIEGFYYDFGENGVCANQTKFTGKFYNEAVNGYCYAISGELQTGWYLVDDVWNYYRWADKTAITGTYKFTNGNCAGITYVFDDQGNLTDGVWHTTEDGNIQYFYGPDCYKWANNMLQEIDGKTYCFNKDGYLYRGYQFVKIGAFAQERLYHFDDVTGELIKIYEEETGIIPINDGDYCYLVNGTIQKSLGMITIDGAEYYVRGNGLLAVGKYYIGAGYTGCGHLTPGYYDFGEDGKFIGPWVDENAFTGVKADAEGNLHYYVKDKIQYGLGMITIDGSDYYVRGNGLLAVGKYYVGAGYTGCGHLTPGYYDFGEDGKFVGPWVDENAFTGIKENAEGNLQYYVNDEIQYGLGMITIDGSDYYIRGNGLLAVGKYYVGAGYTGCGHLTPGYYDFGEDGKFIGPWVDENAFTGVKADAEGNLHYYVKDKIQYGLGMITIDGSDYYIRGNGLLAVGKYYIGAGYTGCGHLTPGYYNFGEDGKFAGSWIDENAFTGIKADSEGNLHYYVNDVIQYGLGMITIDGAEYYVRGNGLLAVGKYYVGAGYTGCSHLRPGYYDFGEDGKFVGPWSE